VYRVKRRWGKTPGNQRFRSPTPARYRHLTRIVSPSAVGTGYAVQRCCHDEQPGRRFMADDVDAEADRAANAARASVKRAAAQRSNNLLPVLLVMVLAILSVAALVMTDKDIPQPTQPRVEAPSTTQGN
jgi:hypothetical protein